MSIVGVAMARRRASSCTEDTSGSISIGRPSSTSWRVDGLWPMMSVPPLMHCSMLTPKRAPTASPTAFLILKTGGAAYLLWLAIQAVRYGSNLTVMKVEETRGTPLANIMSGFAVNLLNPKVIIFFMTFLPQFVTANDPAVTHKLLFLGFFFIFICSPFNLAVIFAADRLAGWLQANKHVLRGIDYTFAGVFSIFAAKIFLTQAR